MSKRFRQICIFPDFAEFLPQNAKTEALKLMTLIGLAGGWPGVPATENGGKLVADDEASYRYLAESIRKHPAPDELRAMMEAAGFARCAYTRMTGGLVAIHSGYAV